MGRRPRRRGHGSAALINGQGARSAAAAPRMTRESTSWRKATTLRLGRRQPGSRVKATSPSPLRLARRQDERPLEPPDHPVVLQRPAGVLAPLDRGHQAVLDQRHQGLHPAPGVGLHEPGADCGMEHVRSRASRSLGTREVSGAGGRREPATSAVPRDRQLHPPRRRHRQRPSDLAPHVPLLRSHALAPAVDHQLRGVDGAQAQRPPVVALPLGPAGRGEGVRPADVVPVVDVEGEGDDPPAVGRLLGQSRQQAIRRRTARAPLRGEQLDHHRSALGGGSRRRSRITGHRGSARHEGDERRCQRKGRTDHACLQSSPPRFSPVVALYAEARARLGRL